MTETQIKEYLNKYSITTKEGLAKHVEELKRNTKPNIGLISELVYVLEDEENLFSNLFCGKKLTKLVKDRLDLATEYRNNMFLETPLLRTIKRCSNQCFCDNSCKTESVLGDYDKSKTKGNPIKYNFGLTEQLNSVVGDLEGINRPPQRTVSSHFLDEVLEQLNSAEKENEVNLKTEENKGLSTRLKADKQNLVFTEDSAINKQNDENGKPLTYCGGKEKTEVKPLYTFSKENRYEDKERYSDELAKTLFRLNVETNNKGNITYLFENCEDAISFLTDGIKNKNINKGWVYSKEKDRYRTFLCFKDSSDVKYDIEVNDRSVKSYFCGKKENKNKPQLSLLFKQFPQALEAISKCSEYGHEKYKKTDSDYLNYQRVEGGSKTYADAGLRHRLEQGNDLESGLPHQYHIVWNALAELELWIRENKCKTK